MKYIHAFAAVVCLTVPTFAEWQAPVKLREISGEFSGMQLAMGAPGQAAAIWTEELPAGGQGQYVSVLMPGNEWSTPSLIPAVSARSNFYGAVGMGPDGTIIDVRQYFKDEPPYESLLVARLRAPGGDWQPPKTLSHPGTSPKLAALAVAPNGFVHVAFVEVSSYVVTTSLAPGQEAWSPLTTVARMDEEIIQPPSIVATDRSAFIAVATSHQVSVASYDAGGWHSANTISSPGGSTGNIASLALNGTEALVSWEEEDGSPTGVRWVQQLTRNSEKFKAPQPGCFISLFPDATVVAACVVEGDPIPGCFVTNSHGAKVPVISRYYEAYQRPFSGEWSAPTLLSDPLGSVRSFGSQLLTNAKGHAFLLYHSSKPCQENSQEEFLTREWSPVWSFWQPEEKVATGAPLLADAKVDRRGSVWVLSYHDQFIFDRTPPRQSSLYVSQRPVFGPGAACLVADTYCAK